MLLLNGFDYPIEVFAQKNLSILGISSILLSISIDSMADVIIFLLPNVLHFTLFSFDSCFFELWL